MNKNKSFFRKSHAVQEELEVGREMGDVALNPSWWSEIENMRGRETPQETKTMQHPSTRQNWRNKKVRGRLCAIFHLLVFAWFLLLQALLWIAGGWKPGNSILWASLQATLQLDFASELHTLEIRKWKGEIIVSGSSHGSWPQVTTGGPRSLWAPAPTSANTGL